MRPLRNRTRRVFYGWWIVASVFGIQAMNGVLLHHAFGAYFVHLQNDFGWSKSAISGAFSMARLESGLLGPLQGWLIDKFGPRVIVQIGILLFGAGFILLSFVNSLVTFYAVFVIIVIGSSLGGFLALNASLANWFIRRRAMAMSLGQMGMAFGGMLVPVVAISLATLGWRGTAFYSGVIIIVLGLPLAQLIRRNPEAYGLLPDGRSPIESNETDTGEEPPGEETDFTPREAMRTSAFWFISLGHGLALLVVGSVGVHLVPHLVEHLHISVVQASFVLTVVTTTAIFGQLLGGYFGDRMDKRLIAAACMVGHAVAIVGVAFATFMPAVYFFSMIHGVSWGARGPLMSAIRADYFGRRHFGTIMGFSSMVVMVGSVAGPVFAGFLADQLGSYQVAFTILGIFTGLGFLAFLAAQKPAPPKRPGAPERIGNERS